MRYDIQNIPTVYNGVRYRSRLEAKWAAFFTLAEWRFEYEPFDLPGWSPDFLLIGKNKNVLVEVKPITGQDPDLNKRMLGAVIAADCDLDILLLGVAPFLSGEEYSRRVPCIGWLDEADMRPNTTEKKWVRPYDEYRSEHEYNESLLPFPPLPPLMTRHEYRLCYESHWFDDAQVAIYADHPGKLDFCHETGSFRGRMTGAYDGGCQGAGEPFDDRERWDLVNKLWGSAGALVQYQPRKRVAGASR